MRVSEGLPIDDVLPARGWPIHEYVVFLSEQPTHGSDGCAQSEAMKQTLLEHDPVNPQQLGMPVAVRHIRDLATPEHFQGITAPTLVSSHGGDGTVRDIFTAMMGIVPDDPEATGANYEKSALVCDRVLYVAGSGGNGNNFGESSGGRASYDPKLFKSLPTAIRTVHPLRYELLDAEGEHRLSNIAVTGFGLGATAVTGAYLETKRAMLRKVPSFPRLAYEACVSVAETLATEPFAINVSLQKAGRKAMIELQDQLVLECVKSRVYAKRGRTQVNIDDDLWQPLTLSAGANPLDRTANITGFATRLSTGRHLFKPIDMAGTTMSIVNTGGRPIPFHADGEVGPQQQLNPDETLVMKLANISVHTLMVLPAR